MSILVAPLEALTDSLLSDPERRVLLALFSYRGKVTELVFPSLEALAERSNINDKTRVSKVTTSLAKKGWLTKKKKGFTGCNQYTMCMPERLTNLDSETNLALETNLDADTNSNLAPETKYDVGTRDQVQVTHHRTNHLNKPINKSIVEAKPQRVDHVQPIFDYWVQTMGKTAASKLTAGRRKCVEARLREGYTPEQITLAITGCSKSPHHMGQNDTGSIYDDLTLICRNGENVERFSQITATPNQANPIINNGGFNHGTNQQQSGGCTTAGRQRIAAQQLVNSL